MLNRADLLGLAGLDAHEGGVELLVIARVADLDERRLALAGLTGGVVGDLDVDLDEIAFLRGTFGRRFEARGGVAEAIDLGVDHRLGGRLLLDRDLDAAERGDRHFRQDVEGDPELQRPLGSQLNFVELRRGHRAQIVRLEFLGQDLVRDRFDGIALDVVLELALHDREGNLAGAETGNLGAPRDVPGPLVDLFGDDFLVDVEVDRFANGVFGGEFSFQGLSLGKWWSPDAKGGRRDEPAGRSRDTRSQACSKARWHCTWWSVAAALRARR